MQSGFFGIVEDVNDPEKRCRLKIRVFSKMEDLDLDFIPWSEPDILFNGGDVTGGGNFSLPKIGTLVFIYYLNDDFYHPYWKGIPIPSTSLIEFIGNDYKDAVSLFYDKELNCGSLMLPSKGILNFYKNASILIKNDDTIIIKSNKQTIHINDEISLGSENKSAEPAVLGNKNEDVLNDIVSLLNDIVSLLKSHGQNQSIAASSSFITAGLVPNLTTMMTEAISLIPKIKKIETKIPKIKSKVVNLD